jgi:hypothetical protein
MRVVAVSRESIWRRATSPPRPSCGRPKTMKIIKTDEKDGEDNQPDDYFGESEDEDVVNNMLVTYTKRRDPPYSDMP